MVEHRGRVALRVRWRLWRVACKAIRNGWSVEAAEAIFSGPPRYPTGSVAAWCHTCDAEIPRDQWVAGPTEVEGVVSPVCPRCLNGPPVEHL